MKKNFATITLVLLISFLLVGTLTPVVSAADKTLTTGSSTEIENVVKNEVAAENSHNWSALEDCWINDQKELLISFLGDADNEKKKLDYLMLSLQKFRKLRRCH